MEVGVSRKLGIYVLCFALIKLTLRNEAILQKQRKLAQNENSPANLFHSIKHMFPRLILIFYI